MSKLIENKQLIHIVSEVIVIAGISFYFHKQNNKLSSDIEDLTKRVEAAEDLISKQDIVIRNLISHVNTIPVDQKRQQNHKKKRSVRKKVSRRVKHVSDSDSSDSHVRHPTRSSNTRKHEHEPEPEHEPESEPESEPEPEHEHEPEPELTTLSEISHEETHGADLDLELVNELKELEESSVADISDVQDDEETI